MIDLYAWATPNGFKIAILLEELGLPYRVHGIDITRGAQDTPAFRAVSPSGKIPAIVEEETGLRLMESGAILLHLAERAGRLLGADAAERLDILQWLLWQIGNFGPTLGHAHHFMTYHPGSAPAAERRFGAETRRLYDVLETRLSRRTFVAETHSIADIAIWPWVHRHARHQVDLSDYPSVSRWYEALGRRPAYLRGLAALENQTRQSGEP